MVFQLKCFWCRLVQELTSNQFCPSPNYFVCVLDLPEMVFFVDNSVHWCALLSQESKSSRSSGAYGDEEAFFLWCFLNRGWLPKFSPAHSRWLVLVGSQRKGEDKGKGCWIDFAYWFCVVFCFNAAMCCF